MAQVTIIVTGATDPRKSEIASALGTLLGCPVLVPSRVFEALLQQTGPVAERKALGVLASDTVWRTAGLVEAGVVIDADWTADDAKIVQAGISLAGSPRVVEVTMAGAEAIGVGPVVGPIDFDGFDLDALVQRIAAEFGAGA